jgi:alpha-mannosidase
MDRQDQTSMEKPSFAVPIRGITKQGARLLQPIQLTIGHTGTDAMLVVRADHEEVERRVLSAGTHTFSVYVDPVEAATQVRIDYEIAGKSDSAEVRVEPVRKVEIFILPHSHHDLGFTDLQSNIEAKQMTNISKGIALARVGKDLAATQSSLTDPELANSNDPHAISSRTSSIIGCFGTS